MENSAALQINNPKVQRQREIAEIQVAQFQERYGQEMLDFACHAAFPLTLTTELVYLLRQVYFPHLSWSAAPELLLSNLCDTVGYDLYAMGIPIQRVLLEKLQAQFGDKRIDHLVQWMTGYIQYRLGMENSNRAKILGDPPQWTALACLKNDDEVARAIKEQLRQILAQTDDPNERFRWLALMESYTDLLVQRGLEPVKLQDFVHELENIRLGIQEPQSELEQIRIVMGRAGFPLLQKKKLEYGRLVVKAEADASEVLRQFSFETVQVNAKGEVVATNSGEAWAFSELLPMGQRLEMVAIPSGKFRMGSPPAEHERYGDESPQHQVTVAPFFMGKYPVTQAQWRAIANSPVVERDLTPKPSELIGDDRPVEQVSWEDTMEFCARLSRETGRYYRLPTEAEWEYACRAGTSTPFYFGATITGALANYNSAVVYRQEDPVKQRGQTTSVGDFPPNTFGLYDMHGNVWEWCLDNWHSDYKGAPTDGSAWLSQDSSSRRLLRGGSWGNYPRYCRSAVRYYYNPGNHYYDFGFRVVCEIPRTP